EKTFQFESWCNQMKLSEKEKNELQMFIANSPDKMKEKFRITFNDDKVFSFQGESIILRAQKR
ncbi:MAG: SAM-dependent methyltransferase, partial [Bacillota bacterium]|nr:SAM-dependent methyltransferase [Bacillota bacterium]